MSCTNCYNGCVEITSDKCTRYTGNDIPLLGINNGDSLAVVEQAIFTFLSTVANGSGINPNIGPICTLISNAFPPGEDITLNVILQAISDVICDLDTRITSIEGDIATLNADYTIDCLEGVTNSSDTHEVLQAVIDKLCALQDELDALEASIPATYPTITAMEEYVAAQLAANQTTLYYKNMVPWVALPYFGEINGNFGPTGAGVGAWEKVYICNGENGTPDMRGFSPVGATTNSGGGDFDPIIAMPYNPSAASVTYNKNEAKGTLKETLTTYQMPTHTHSANVTVTVPAHTHETTGEWRIYGTNSHEVDKKAAGNTMWAVEYTDNRTTTGLSTVPEQTLTASTTIMSTGNSQPHNNVPPVRVCYFIMYVP